MFFSKKVNIREAKYKLIQSKINVLIDLLLESGADIHHAPNSHEYFLVDTEKNISIGIEQSRIRVANHNYTYSDSLPLNSIEKLKVKVRNELERRTQFLKKDLFKNELDLINKITRIYNEE